MMENPLLSVVIPAYNEEKFLAQTLASLQAQRVDFPFEVIVVDNNSDDKTVQIAKAFGANVVFEPRRGYAYACNRGFYQAKGEIIARCDADYILPANWLETIRTTFSKNSNLIAIGGPTYPLESYWWENLFYYPSVLLFMYTLKLFGRGFLFPNMAVRKETFIKTGGFNSAIRFGEDTDLCRRLSRFGEVKLLPHLYVHTSSRRLRSLGFFKFVFGYVLLNQILQIGGREPSIGLEVVRNVALPPSHPQKPWGYLLLSLSLFACILTVLFASLFHPTTVSASISKATAKPLKKVLALNWQISSFSKKMQIKARITPYIHKILPQDIRYSDVF